MTRKLKLCVAVAIAAAGISAFQGPAAEAHTPALFNSEVEDPAISSRLDGTFAGEFHHDLELLNLPLTCLEVSFKGGFKTKSTTEISLAVEFGTFQCKYNGSSAKVEMKGCNYIFRANGDFAIGNKEGKECSKEPIEVLAQECTFKLPPQTIKGALTYTNILVGGVKEVTVANKATAIEYSAEGAKCAGKGNFANGRFTQARTILRAANSKGALTDFTWTATVP
jgi:hypothetical protein